MNKSVKGEYAHGLGGPLEAVANGCGSSGESRSHRSSPRTSKSSARRDRPALFGSGIAQSARLLQSRIT